MCVKYGIMLFDSYIWTFNSDLKQQSLRKNNKKDNNSK